MTGTATRGEPETTYRANPALNFSTLATVLDCPARAKWNRDNPTDTTSTTFGTVVHSLALGAGQSVTVVDADRRTKAYAAAAEQAQADGAILISASDYERAQNTARALHEHPLAGPMLAAPGDSELTLRWDDEETGRAMKARVDRATITPDGTHWVFDVKTTGTTANPRAFARGPVVAYRYHMQRAIYRAGYQAVTGVWPEFRFLVVESKPPHLVSVVNLDSDADDRGWDAYRAALDTWIACERTGHWHGYTETVDETVSVPPWA